MERRLIGASRANLSILVTPGSLEAVQRYRLAVEDPHPATEVWTKNNERR